MVEQYDAPAEARQVLQFWLEDALERGWPSRNLMKLWFGGGPALDRDIDHRFGHLVRDALSDGLTTWEATAQDRLALVILLDQFSRNVFRGQAKAFDGDGRAQRLALDTFARGWREQLPLAGQVFLVMPLMHAEDLALQDQCLTRLQQIKANAPSEQAHNLDDNIESAKIHRDIIARFGRFPHRNRMLGRTATAEEQAFLQQGPRFGQ